MILCHYLSLGYSRRKTAERAKVSKTTITRLWRTDKSFRQEVRRECQLRLENHNRVVAGAAGKATRVLRDLLGEEHHPATRLKAAQAILGRADQVFQLSTISRMEDLEQMLADLMVGH